MELYESSVSFENAEELKEMKRYIHYTKWFDQISALESSIEELFNLFRNILLQTNGDVNEALNWMTTLNNRYNFTENLGAFIDRLKEDGIIREEGQVYILTSKGSQTDKVSILDRSRLHCFGQCDRNGSGSGIAIFLDVIPDLLIA